MRTSHEEVPAVNLLTRSSSDILTAVPIKKRRLMLARSPSPPPHVSSSLPADSAVPPKSSEPESSVSQTFSQPALGTSLTSKGSSEPRVESVVRTYLNASPESESPPSSDLQGLGPNMAGRNTRQVKESTPDSICTLLPVTEGTQQLSATEPFKLPVKERCDGLKHVPSDSSTFFTVSGIVKPQLALKDPLGLKPAEQKCVPSDSSAFSTVPKNAKFQLALKDPFGLPKDGQNSENISMNQEKSDPCSWNLAFAGREQNIQSKCEDAESKVESCLNRSNWDLNTTMDAWEGLPSVPAENNANGGHCLDVGGMQGKRPVLGPVQMLYKNHVGDDATAGKCMLGMRVGSSSLSMSMNEVSNSETFLDLQLKPSFMAESFFKWGSTCPLGKVDSIKEMPLLSLTMKPSSSGCNSTLVASRAVKTELYEGSSPKDTWKIEIPGLKSAIKHVKSEPCERQESPKSACSRAVKSEPPEDQSQGYLRRQNTLSTTQSTEMPHDAAEHVSKSLESQVPDGRLLPKGIQLPDAMMLQDPSQTVGKTQDLVAQPPTPLNNEIDRGEKMRMCSGIPPYGKGIVTESSDLVQESLVSEDKKSNVFKLASKIDDLAPTPSKPSLSDFKEHMVADVKPEGVAQMSCIDGYNSSSVASSDELPIYSNAKSKVAESSEEKIEQVDEALEKQRDHEKESNNFHEETGTVDAVHKRSREDDDYEDGEFRGRALLGTVEGSREEREEKQVKATDCMCPIDVPVEGPHCIDPNEGKVENSEESKTHDTENCGRSQCCQEDDQGISTITNLHVSSADGVLAAGSGKKRLVKTIRKVPRVHLKDKGTEKKPKSDRVFSARTIIKGSHDEVSSQQADTLMLDEVPVSKKESSVNVDANKTDNSSVIDHKPARDAVASGKGKSFPGRLISLPVEKERFIDNSLRREKPQSRRIRDEKNRYRSQIFERVRNKDQPCGSRGSDLMLIRSRAENQPNDMPSERNYDHGHVSEQVDSSTGAQYVNGSNGNAGRMVRNLMDVELQNQSHISYRGRLPSGRGRIPVRNQMIHHPTKDSSPSGHPGRDVPDFMLRAHDERLMRTLPDGRLVYPQYERGEGNLIRRGRRSLSPLVCRERSLSPLQRRGPGFSPNCMESSPRSEARHLQQWSPSRRSLVGFNGPLELMGRSIRPDRVRSRSPHQRPFFAEDMIVRRRGSPPYITRLPDDAGEVSSSRGQDFPRPVRGLQRDIIWRSEMMNSRDFPEEYFSPGFHNQCGELAGDVECVVDHTFRQRRIHSDDVNETFRSHVDAPPGPFRFSHENDDGFTERGSPRDYEGNVRNRLGGRSRGIQEEEDNYRYRGEPEWRNDVRLKRRRVERQ